MTVSLQEGLAEAVVMMLLLLVRLVLNGPCLHTIGGPRPLLLVAELGPLTQLLPAREQQGCWGQCSNFLPRLGRHPSSRQASSTAAGRLLLGWGWCALSHHTTGNDQGSRVLGKEGWEQKTQRTLVIEQSPALLLRSQCERSSVDFEGTLSQALGRAPQKRLPSYCEQLSIPST